MIIGTWGSNKNFWGGGRISALTNGTHLNKLLNKKRPGDPVLFSTRTLIPTPPGYQAPLEYILKNLARFCKICRFKKKNWLSVPYKGVVYKTQVREVKYLGTPNQNDSL